MKTAPLSGEVPGNIHWGPDAVDFEELRLQPLGQQQGPVHAEQSFSWPRAVWRQSRFMDFQLGDYQDCKWWLNTPGFSAESQLMSLGKGAFLHALFAFSMGLYIILPPHKSIEVS